MQACLADEREGYYTSRQPIGAAGDFVTSPEVSQIFGELLGLWAVAVWQSMGEPNSVVVAELGPGRGTLLADASRAWRSVKPFAGCVSLALIETSPVLRETQRKALRASHAPIQWCNTIDDVPEGRPLIVIANEFIDALPVRQLVRRDGVWRERCIGLSPQDAFVFTDGDVVQDDSLPPAPDGAILEMRPTASSLLASLACRAAAAPLAALILDYGHAESGTGDTLQAVRRHRYADPLALPGETDLTAHVDFAALKQSAQALGLEGLWAHAARRVPAETWAWRAARPAARSGASRAEGGDPVGGGAPCRSRPDGSPVQIARADERWACPAAPLRGHLARTLAPAMVTPDKMKLCASSLAAIDGVAHGFFTRQGGVSRGIYASLNCGPGSGDDAGCVQENRARVAEILGAEPTRLLTLFQKHSATAVVAKSPWEAGSMPEADAIVTATPGLAVGVLTADCTPVLFCDGEARVVGAAHAGWRGALSGIVEATVEAMTDARRLP